MTRWGLWRIETSTRMQIVHGHPDNAQIIVDYAHTPARRRLAALRPAATGSLPCCLGVAVTVIRANVQKWGGLRTLVLIRSLSPTITHAPKIRQHPGVISACPNAIEIASRDKAIAAALSSVGSGDVLLIAGKGMKPSSLSVMRACHLMMPLLPAI